MVLALLGKESRGGSDLGGDHTRALACLGASSAAVLG